MKCDLSSDALKGISDGMKKLANSAIEIVESTRFYADGKVIAKVDTTTKVLYETKGSVDLITLLEWLASGKVLPRKIVYDDIIYTNVTRTGMALLYYNDETEQNFKDTLFQRKPGETDIDILNREIGVIEW